jgi:amino acid adenylation domain-containing protein
MMSPHSIPARFEQIAVRHPARVAIRTDGRHLTYQQLNADANRLAHAIGMAQGTVRGRVALLFEQGADAIMATLGVLKTGHAFVPLDALDESDRTKDMIRDCAPLVIVTAQDHLAAAKELAATDIPVLCVEELPSGLSAQNPGVAIPPETTAYVFYTSGSTGKPKGVCQNHRNVLHFVGVYSDSLAISAEDRLTLLYSPAFSASNMDVFGALLNGATLFPYDIRKRGTAALADWLADHAITILHAVPTVFRHLTRSLEAGRKFASIRGIDLGGESMVPDDIELRRRHFRADCLFINHLAATEASVIAQYPIDANATYAGNLLPVGKAAPGMKIRIVRSDGSDAAVGENGDIVLSSQYLSTGYWQRPDLDAMAFGSDPGNPDRRTYHTGDMGSIDKDGQLYFLGRKDHRVKVRGHTVDPSEVEAAIRGCAAVRDVAVVVREIREIDEAGQLTAFLAGNNTLNSQLDELRGQLRKRLPSYMIPAEFIVLETLPSISSGKLDRVTMSRMARREIRESKTYEAPVGHHENLVATLFCKLLRQQRAGRHDDFFLLGGDSLKATLLHVQLEDRIRRRIPLEKLFRDSSVHGIAGLIASIETADEPPSTGDAVLVALRESGHLPRLFLVHGAKGQAFVSPHFLTILGDGQPVYAFQANGLDRSRKGHASIHNMAREYILAMRQVQPGGPYLVASLCVGYVVAIEIARQLNAVGEKVGPLVLIDPPVRSIMDYGLRKRVGRIARIELRKLLMPFTSEERFNRAITKRVRQGRMNLDTTSTRSVRAALRAALDFEIALLKYRLPEYSEIVFVLGSEERWKKNAQAATGSIHRKITGGRKIFPIGEKHSEVHDVTNGLFASQLQQAMQQAIAAIHPSAPR